MVMKPRLGILISGRGSNLQAIIDSIVRDQLDAEIAVVISNKEQAAGLERARNAGIDTVVLSHKDYGTREMFDAALVDGLKAYRVSLVCLAGFMRLLSSNFVAAFPGAILNVHPSLLPSFPGLDAQRQALDYGAKVSGATVHIVTATLDNGPIVLQASVPVVEGDTVESLSDRILVQEHRIYPEAIKLVLGGGWKVDGRRFGAELP